ncbi:MAG TPA: hypothetical protein VIG46_07480 [Candidatus Baltobacteraceae bacterium]
MKKVIALLALAALGLSAAPIARAGQIDTSLLPSGGPAHKAVRWVYNMSHSCAWITIDIGGPMVAWHNVEHRYIQPGDFVKFEVQGLQDLKVRAEPTLRVDCSGGKVADLSIVEKGAATATASTLFSADGRYHLRWGTPNGNRI